MLKDNRIKIICGHYGSGKTEFAINYSLALKKIKKRVAIADMDVVNPYFRSREKAKLLNDKGIKTIYSSIEGTALDIPAVSGEVGTLIANDLWDLVLDIGGNDVGARALARYAKEIPKDDYDMFFVINAYRPETSTVEGIISQLKSIENTMGIPVTGLVNNTHMMKDTTLEDVLYGQNISKEVSKSLGIPIKYISCIENIAKELPQELKDTCIITSLIMREDWMS